MDPITRRVRALSQTLWDEASGHEVYEVLTAFGICVEQAIRQLPEDEQMSTAEGWTLLLQQHLSKKH